MNCNNTPAFYNKKPRKSKILRGFWVLYNSLKAGNNSRSAMFYGSTNPDKTPLALVCNECLLSL